MQYLHSGTESSGWLRHCCGVSLKLPTVKENGQVLPVCGSKMVSFFESFLTRPSPRSFLQTFLLPSHICAYSRPTTADRSWKVQHGLHHDVKINAMRYGVPTMSSTSSIGDNTPGNCYQREG
jgi:hypothetical protein